MGFTVSDTSGVWIDLALGVFVILMFLIWYVWKKWLWNFQNHPLDHYLGRHNHCNGRFCSKKAAFRRIGYDPHLAERKR